MFTPTQDCTTAKEAWEILHTRCEGDLSVLESKVKLRLNQHENLMMAEDETITNYVQSLLSITKECQILGKTISTEQIVGIILRSLSSKFQAYQFLLIENQHLDTIHLEALIDNLKNYELNLEEQNRNKNQDISVYTRINEKQELVDDLCDSDDLSIHFQK